MERVRATWTDERLDDLSTRMDDGFDRIDQDLRSLRVEVSGRINSLEQRLDRLQHLMVQLAGGMTVGIVATLISVLATRA